MEIEEFNSKFASPDLRAGIVRKRPEWGYAFACGNVYVPHMLARKVQDGDRVVVAVRTCTDGRFAADEVWPFDEYVATRINGEEFIPPPVATRPAPVTEFVSGSGRILEAQVTGLKRKLMARGEWAGAKGVVVGLEYHVTVSSPSADSVDASTRKIEVSDASTPTFDVDVGDWQLVISRSVKLHGLLEEDGKVTDWELHEERLRGVAEAVLTEMMAR